MRDLTCIVGLSSICIFWMVATHADELPKTNTQTPAKEETVKGAVSPDDAFAVFQKCVAKDDWKSAFGVQTERSRDFIVGGSLAACDQGIAGENGAKLVTEFADQKKVKELIEKAMKAAEGEQQKIVAELAALVKKKAEFMSRVLTLFKEQKKEFWLKDIADAKLVDVKIDGDRATAQMEFRVGKRGKAQEPAAFLKKDGRWYFDYTDH